MTPDGPPDANHRQPDALTIDRLLPRIGGASGASGASLRRAAGVREPETRHTPTWSPSGWAYAVFVPGCAWR